MKIVECPFDGNKYYRLKTNEMSDGRIHWQLEYLYNGVVFSFFESGIAKNMKSVYAEAKKSKNRVLTDTFVQQRVLSDTFGLFSA